MMNHGREKREERSEREKKETKILKRAVGEYKMIFFFYFFIFNNLAIVSLYLGMEPEL